MNKRWYMLVFQQRQISENDDTAVTNPNKLTGPEKVAILSIIGPKPPRLQLDIVLVTPVVKTKLQPITLRRLRSKWF